MKIITTSSHDKIIIAIIIFNSLSTTHTTVYTIKKLLDYLYIMTNVALFYLLILIILLVVEQGCYLLPLIATTSLLHYNVI